MTVARQLGVGLGLVGGIAAGTSDVPENIQAERGRGVPNFMVGFPIAQAPKVARYLFLLELSVPVMEPGPHGGRRVHGGGRGHFLTGTLLTQATHTGSSQLPPKPVAMPFITT